MTRIKFVLDEKYELSGTGLVRETPEELEQMPPDEVIEVLEAMPEGALVANLRNPHSYRGYYDDLALEPFEGLRPARELLQECRAVMGKALMGYKGGQYVMGEMTPVWVSGYGVASGMRLMALHPDGKVDVAEEEWES